MNVKGWNSHVHRGFPGKLESSKVSRDNVSREIGRDTGVPGGSRRLLLLQIIILIIIITIDYLTIMIIIIIDYLNL